MGVEEEGKETRRREKAAKPENLSSFPEQPGFMSQVASGQEGLGGPQPPLSFRAGAGLSNMEPALCSCEKESLPSEHCRLRVLHALQDWKSSIC